MLWSLLLIILVIIGFEFNSETGPSFMVNRGALVVSRVSFWPASEGTTMNDYAELILLRVFRGRNRCIDYVTSCVHRKISALPCSARLLASVQNSSSECSLLALAVPVNRSFGSNAALEVLPT
jgi:hypothetical protein